MTAYPTAAGVGKWNRDSNLQLTSHAAAVAPHKAYHIRNIPALPRFRGFRSILSLDPFGQRLEISSALKQREVGVEWILAVCYATVTKELKNSK